MQKEKIVAIINDLSGSARKKDEDKFLRELENKYIVESVFLISDSKDSFELGSYNTVAVYGGDGTLNSVLSKLPKDRAIEILYKPSGTLNELSKTIKSKSKNLPMLTETGIFANRRFAYVAAAGTFTEIGTKVKVQNKKRFKLLAYFFDVLKNYKIHNIKAKIATNRETFEDVFTLMMFIDSNRCFGFRFNALYKPNDNKLHLLLLKAPKGKGIFSKIKIFFPLFRVFFLGMRKEKRGKSITFVEVKSATVSLKSEQTFCFDGESRKIGGAVKVGVQSLLAPIRLIV